MSVSSRRSEASRAAEQPAATAADPDRGGGQHHVRPGDDVGHQGADDRLGVPVAVDVGGVDQGAAGPDERLQLRRGGVGVGVPAPGHGAQRQAGTPRSPLRPTRRSLHACQPTTAGRAPAAPADRRCAASPRPRYRWPARRHPARNGPTATGKGSVRMRLGLNLGYATTAAEIAGQSRSWPCSPRNSATTWSGPPRPTGRTPRRVLAAVAARTETHRHRVGGPADPRPHPGDDRDDRGHPRRAVRRSVPARPRRLRAAGLRGLARGAVRRPDRPHPGVRPHRPAGAGPPSGGGRRRPLHPAAAGRAGQVAAAVAAAGPRRRSRSTWPRSARRTWR